ncbi:carbamoyltransferase [bacterium]|nr:carbamoyltransferase [bacterium]
MYILGISCFYHDSAACLIKDGEIIAAAQEERFTRKKHDFEFPKNAVEFCLSFAKITVNNLDYVCFYEKPLVKFERILETYLSYTPVGVRSFLKSIPLWIKQRLWIPDLIKNELGYNGEILFSDHHLSHAASAFYPSPFKDAAILTMDGVGEWTTASFGIGKGNLVKLQYEMKFPHSLGLLYSAFTYYTGFKVNSGEYKVMGLAPYGKPKYYNIIMEELIDLKDDGSFRLNMEYFDYCAGLRMTNSKFNKLFGGKPRKPETLLTQREMDIAHSIQKVTEEIMLKLANHVHRITHQKYLCLAGGVALNCVGNGRILREGPFEEIWIQPAAGDAGGALGAALACWYGFLKKPRKASGLRDFQKASYLGPEYDDSYILNFIEKNNIPYKKLEIEEIPEVISKLVANEYVIGWFEGRMEFGPRALGSRSIIGDPRSAKMQSIMNLKIKFRESFRPFAPSVLLEKVSDVFDLDRGSPYMLFVAPVKKEMRRELSEDEKKLCGIDKLKAMRSGIPAVTHVDYSARIQTVSRDNNPLYYNMINSFYQKTGCPLVINTSFNVRGEPIVCSPEDAYLCFMRTNMDYLIMGKYLLDKKAQKPLEKDVDWKKKFGLD